MAAYVELPLVVIVGPTASGKTAVALELAEAVGGEIICADSRTVYEGLDIGTAKPTAIERSRVPHHVLDVVRPDEQYTMARFQADAKAAIADIRSRGKIPFLVGGSGLYVDSVILEYELSAPPNAERRAELEAMTPDELFCYCGDNNIKLPNNLHNKRYVIRAIEQNGINTTRRDTPIDNSIIVGITTDSDTLKARIEHRAEAMFANGVIGEARRAAATYGWDSAPLQAPAYRIARDVIDGQLTLQQAVEAQARADWQLARKQLTWLRRNRFINCVELDEASAFVYQKLAQ